MLPGPVGVTVLTVPLLMHLPALKAANKLHQTEKDACY
jgi:hypothetical protein